MHKKDTFFLAAICFFSFLSQKQEGVDTSVFGAAEGREREGWDKALCKSHSTTVPDLNQNLVTENKQEKLLKWERGRERRRQQERTYKKNQEGRFFCWECRNGSMSYLPHFLGNHPL